MQHTDCDKNAGVDAKSIENSTHEESVSGDDDDFTPVIYRKKRMEMKKKI
jgi:hypothetical protein